MTTSPLAMANASMAIARGTRPEAIGEADYGKLSTTAKEIAISYVRVSTKEQAEMGGEAEGFSIPAQRDACHRKATAIGAHVVEDFIDRGESAKTSARPELQRMLTYIKTHRVKYLIVHKVDRLARNRADDVAINLALQQAGVTLVSVTENIDETPSGILLHGIMSSIAEFYSRNLGTEVIKGSVQKAKAGGTPTRAPIGYKNVRYMENGREIRTVDVDEMNGPLMQWAFEAYATGDWTLRKLLKELTARGLRTLPSKNRTGKPLVISHLHRLLRHPYYMGIVQYRGVLYEGKHDKLVTPETWYRVQELLTTKNISGELQREHHHYLKGTVYCGECKSRLIVNIAKGRGGSYPYFVCIGRQEKRTNCTQRALRIEDVEQFVLDHYSTVQLTDEQVVRLRAFLLEELNVLRTTAEREQAVQRRRMSQLTEERKKLLDAHYADAVPLDLLKSEQARIAQELTSIERVLKAVAADFKTAEANLTRAIELAANCRGAYAEATDSVRRKCNQAIFKRVFITDEGGVTSELAEPFDVLLDQELRQAITSKTEDDLRDRVDEILRERGVEAEEGSEDREGHEERELALVGAETKQPSTSFSVGGCNGDYLVVLARHTSRYPLPETQAQIDANGTEVQPKPRMQEQRRLSSAEISQLVSNRKAGRTVDELARDFGVHRTTVMDHLKRNKVPSRRDLMDDPGKASIAMRLYAEGNSLASIGEVLGVSSDTVGRCLQKAGIKLRPKGRRRKQASDGT